MEIYDKFTVVDEKSFTDFKVQRSGHNENKLAFCDIIEFAALEFHIDNYYAKLKIKGIGNISITEVPLAQIIRWEWNHKGEQVIKERKTLNIGCNLELSNIHSSCSIVVRILQKREESNEKLCPPLSSPADDLTLQIGDKKITLSAAWFMFVSPVFRRMLSVEMREKQERLITLDELDVDMEQFMEFMEAISPSVLHTPLLPNPKNVLVLLKLSDFFQVGSLKSRCETHLINCAEIPLIQRFLLIDKYGLNNLKNFFLRLNVDNLRSFFKWNRAQLLSVVNIELLIEFTFLLAG